MGLLESTFKLIFKADTAAAKAAIKELSGEEKKAAQARLEQLEASNQAAESVLKKWAKVAVGIAAAGVAIKVGFDAIEFAGKRADLASAAAGVSIEGLRKATFGLRTDTELLTTAAKLNHSVFTLTQADMETAAKAMTALGERGGDAQEAIDAVTEALVTGKTKGLKQYGIEVDETKDKAAKYADIMRQLAVVSGEVSDSSFDASDKVGMLKVTFANAVDEMKLGLGKLAMALAPLLELLAKAVGLIAKAANAALEGVDEWMREAQDSKATVGGAVAGGRGLAADAALRERVLRLQKGGNFTGLTSGLGGLAGPTGGIGNSLDSGPKGGGAGVNAGEEEQRYKDQLEALWAAAGYDTRYVDVGGLQSPEASKVDWGAIDAGFKRLEDDARATGTEFGSRDSRYAAYQNKKESSFLSKTFGDLSDFDAYKEAFSALTGAVGASLSAWIDGSLSAGAAFKKFIGEALKGLAVQLAVESLKHGAYALGSLAFGDFAGAARHGVAAAEFAVAAAAAAVGAKEMGVGAKQPASAKSAPNVSSSGGAGTGSSTTIIAYSDSFADDTARNKQLRAVAIVGKVVGNSAVQHA